MSIFDSMKDRVNAAGAGSRSDLVHTLLQQSGGLSGLAQTFHQKGLGGVVQSWIGTGPNQSITPESVIHAVGQDRIAQIAARFGMTPEQASAVLSQVLPQVVDKMTPQGTLPEEAIPQQQAS